MPSRRPAAPNPRPSSRPASRTSGRPAARAGGRTRSTGASKSTKGSTSSGRTPSRSTRRPSGPARDERRRSRLGLVLPEVLTVRLLVLGVVGLLAFVLLLPTVRGAVQQQAQIDRLQAELDAHRSERAELQDELDRWDDRSYVIQQARSRLNYVVPGDTVWRVVDAQEIEGDVAAQAEAEAGPTVAAAPTGAPWYEGLWESVQVTDRAVVPPEGASPTGSPSSAPSSSSAPSPSDGDERDGAGDASPAPDGGE